MLALCVSSSGGTEGQRESTFSMENMESNHAMSKSIVSSSDGTDNQTISTDLMEMDSHIFQSCLLSMESTEAQSISTHPVQPVEIRPLLSRADFTPRLIFSSTFYLPPCSSLPLTFPEFRRSIIFYPASNMSNLGDIGYFGDLSCPSHRFSELHHQAPYMFIRPRILMSRDVTDCEIFCYDPAVIPMMALLQPCHLIFLSTKEGV
jgi:hypothetical protein